MVSGAYLGILHLFQVCKGYYAFLCRLVRAHGVVVCGGYWVSLGGEEVGAILFPAKKYVIKYLVISK